MKDFSRKTLSAPSKLSFQAVLPHKQAYFFTSRSHTSLESCPACPMWLKQQKKPCCHVHCYLSLVQYSIQLSCSCADWQCSLSLTLGSLFKLLSSVWCAGCVIISLRVISLPFSFCLILALCRLWTECTQTVLQTGSHRLPAGPAQDKESI